MHSIAINLLTQAIPDLKLLVLFGSQAKGTATEWSDWDIAFLREAAVAGWEQLTLDQQIADVLAIPSDRLDLVDLRHCSPLLGYAVAKDGQVLYEAEPGAFRLFQVKAAKTYANTAKLRGYQRDYIQRGLERLEP